MSTGQERPSRNEPGGVRPGGTAGADDDKAGRRSGRAGSDRSGGGPTAGGSAASTKNTVGWVATLVAALVTAWQIVFALTIDGTASASQDVYASVSLFVTLILAVGAMVLGLVGLAQKRTPNWPAVVGLAVGAQVFLVSVASWIGGLMNTGT